MKYKKYLSYLFLISLILPSSVSRSWASEVQPPEVKNLILMITDGTSWPVLSAARWYQRYLEPTQKNLYLDPYISGTVITFCSDSPIGDSAPTTSCYVTGMPSIAGFVATYPYSVKGADLVAVDTTRAYRPMMTLLEAGKQFQKKRTGLVFTCEFPHATPADCSAHSYSRKKYEWIIPQMIHNGIDVVIGGGAGFMKPEYQSYLEQQGYAVVLDNKAAAASSQADKIWQLYSKRDMPYDIDRDPALQPSLAEMTTDALQRLSRGEGAQNGFFLMVEGSKVDWAAHANDPVALVTEFLAFDKAFKAALDFAQKDGHTAIVVTSDHGNSGFSIGRRDLQHYARQPKDKIYGSLVKVRRTSEGLAKMLNERPNAEVQDIFQTYAAFTLSPRELEQLNNCAQYKNSPIPPHKRSKQQAGHGRYKGQTASLINEFFLNRMPFDFTTNGHTGEEVFLAVYVPEGTPSLRGVVQNTDLYHYMHGLMGLKEKLEEQSDVFFAPHDEVFQGLQTEIKTDAAGQPLLLVYGTDAKVLEITAYTNVAKLIDSRTKAILTTHYLPLSAVYVDKTHKVYLPRTAAQLLR